MANNAKKFVKVTGLNKVFDTITTTGRCTIKSGVTTADSESILYIVADSTDATLFGNMYREGTRWIWAKGQLYSGNNVDTEYLSSIENIAGAIDLTDNLETILRKLKKQVEDAASSGVQSITVSDDNIIDLTINPSSGVGAVTISASHAKQTGLPTSVQGAKTSDIKFDIPSIKVNEYGHVTDASTVNVSLGDAALCASTAFEKAFTDGSATIASVDANNVVTLKGGVKQTNGAIANSDASDITLAKVAKTGTFGDLVNIPGGVLNISTGKGIADISTSFTDNASTNTLITIEHAAVKNPSTATATDGTYISNITYDEFGHIANVANKTNGVYATDTHTADEIVLWNSTNNDVKTSGVTIANTVEEADSSTKTVTTSKAVIDYVSSRLSGLIGAFVYKGIVSSTQPLPTTNLKKGWVYLVAEDGTYDGKAAQIGDMFVYNGTSWDLIQGKVNVVNKDALIGLDSSLVELAVVEGVSIKAGHATCTTTTDTDTSVLASKTFNALTGVNTSNGHVTKLTTTTFTLPDVSVVDKAATLDATSTTVATIEGTDITLKAAYANDTTFGYVKITDSSVYKSDSSTAASAKALAILQEEVINNEEVVATAINQLDSSIKAMNVTDTPVAGKYVASVSQVNGVISVERADLPAAADEKVLAESNTGKSVLLGQLDASKGTTNKATYDEAVYMSAGTLYATNVDVTGALKVNSVDINTLYSPISSAASDWGEIN